MAERVAKGNYLHEEGEMALVGKQKEVKDPDTKGKAVNMATMLEDTEKRRLAI